MMFDRNHQGDQGWNQKYRNPRPSDELGNQHHNHRDPRGAGADSVDRHVMLRARILRLAPVRNHAALGERESQERAHRIQRNQPVRHAAEYCQQDCRQDREHVDALRIDQPPSAQRKTRRRPVAEFCEITRQRSAEIHAKAVLAEKGPERE